MSRLRALPAPTEHACMRALVQDRDLWGGPVPRLRGRRVPAHGGGNQLALERMRTVVQGEDVRGADLCRLLRVRVPTSPCRRVCPLVHHNHLFPRRVRRVWTRNLPISAAATFGAITSAWTSATITVASISAATAVAPSPLPTLSAPSPSTPLATPVAATTAGR